jgi:hypothetical protein
MRKLERCLRLVRRERDQCHVIELGKLKSGYNLDSRCRVIELRKLKSGYNLDRWTKRKSLSGWNSYRAAQIPYLTKQVPGIRISKPLGTRACCSGSCRLSRKTPATVFWNVAGARLDLIP